MGACLSTSRRSRRSVSNPDNTNAIKKNSISTEVLLVDPEKLKDYKPRSRRHLVVDDDANNRRTLVTYLNLMNIDTDQCADGEEVVAIGPDKLGKYDVVWMDIRMQKMDGITCSRNIRAMGYQNCIIAITGDATEHTLRKCLEVGVDLLMRKPIFIDSLQRLPVLQN